MSPGFHITSPIASCPSALACIVLDALPEPFAQFPVQGDERAADIAPGASLGHQGEGWLTGLALDAK